MKKSEAGLLGNWNEGAPVEKRNKRPRRRKQSGRNESPCHRCCSGHCRGQSNAYSQGDHVMQRDLDGDKRPSLDQGQSPARLPVFLLRMHARRNGGLTSLASEK